jgi:Cysteine-rich CPCC
MSNTFLWVNHNIDSFYILHGEMSIKRVNRNGIIEWDFYGQDIFVFLNSEKNLIIERNQIKVMDFSGNYYILDFDGSLISNLIEEHQFSSKYTCPCCGYKTLDKRFEYDICPICYWEDDPTQFYNTYEICGPNHISLVHAQINFLKFGACDRKCIDSVRKPNKKVIKNLTWKPILQLDLNFRR